MTFFYAIIELINSCFCTIVVHMVLMVLNIKVDMICACFLLDK